MTYIVKPAPLNSGNCAMKMRIARALTKPVMTDFETKRITSAILASPAMIWITPVSSVATSRYCSP